MSAVAHFFVAVSGSFIHERMAQLFVDFYRNGRTAKEKHNPYCIVKAGVSFLGVDTPALINNLV